MRSRLAIRFADGPLALVEIVVARVRRNLAAVDLGDFRDDTVHELAVVRRHQQAAGSRFQQLLEPDDRLDVEVVRRLVHQQDVGFSEQDASHRHPHLPPARERSDIAVNPLVVEPEPVQDLAGAALEGVAAKMLVLFLHDAEAFELASMSPAFDGSAIACWRSSSSWWSAPNRPLPAIASSSTDRPDISSTSCLKYPMVTFRGTDTSPSSGLSSPVIIRKSVVFPEPFGPTRPTFSPSFNWNEASTNRPVCRTAC